MAWAKVDDQFQRHPKFIGVSLGAVGLWVAGNAYCNNYITDGHVALKTMRAIASGEDWEPLAQQLVEAGLWDVREDGDGWDVHNFLLYNASADEVRALRKKRADAGRKGGDARAAALAKKGERPAPTRKASDVAEAKQVAKQVARPLSSPQPSPAQPSPSGCKSSGSSSPVARDAAESPSDEPTASPDGDQSRSGPHEDTGPDPVETAFAQFWAAFPKRQGRLVGKADTARRWRKLRPAEREKALVAVAHYAAERGDDHPIAAKDPARWLQAGSWRDYLEPPSDNVRPINGRPAQLTAVQRVAQRRAAEQQGATP